MTDKPTPEQIQQACDLANAAASERGAWELGDYSQIGVFTALADTIAKLDAMQAERDKARADLAEIDRIAKAALWHINLPTGPSNRVAAIAAPYRVETDPLEAEADKLMAMDQSTRVIVLSALKRGLEIGRAA